MPAINRQATNSFTIKGWSITLSSALYTYTASHLSWWLALVAVLPGIVFGFLNVYYLHIERMFRELYQDVADRDPDVPPFSLNIERYKDGDLYPYCRRRKVWRSTSVWILYFSNAAIGLILFVVAICQSDRAKDLAECVANTF